MELTGESADQHIEEQAVEHQDLAILQGLEVDKSETATPPPQVKKRKSHASAC